jgi:hypothetical protein
MFKFIICFPKYLLDVVLFYLTVPAPNQFVQATQDVSSTSSSAATLNLIADVAMGGMQSTNFLPVDGGNQGLPNVMSSLSSTATNSLSVLPPNAKPNVSIKASEISSIAE